MRFSIACVPGTVLRGRKSEACSLLLRILLVVWSMENRALQVAGWATSSTETFRPFPSSWKTTKVTEHITDHGRHRCLSLIASSCPLVVQQFHYRGDTQKRGLAPALQSCTLSSIRDLSSLAARGGELAGFGALCLLHFAWVIILSFM